MVRVEFYPVCAKGQNMVSQEYTKLKDLLTLKVGMSETHCQILQAMKGLYQNDINSTRRLEEIDTVGQLLKVLEIRDLLSEENTLPLKVLAQQLSNNTELIRKITDYEKSYLPMPRVNQYVLQPQQYITPQKEPIANTGKYSSFMDGISDTKRELIIETITEEIGSHWRNLARYLGVQEYKIDEIQCKNMRLSEKASEILDLYYKKADRQKWFFDLMDALEKAHRRDLSDDMKKIATMNI